MIVKIQRPISHNEDSPHLLICNADKSVYLFHRMTDEIMKHFKEYELKIYVDANLHDKRNVEIHRKVKEKKW